MFPIPINEQIPIIQIFLKKNVYEHLIKEERLIAGLGSQELKSLCASHVSLVGVNVKS